MVEEVKNPPESSPDVQDTKKSDTGKSAEERIKELEATNKTFAEEKEKAEKSHKNLEELYGRQTKELGELRQVKEEHSALISKAQSATGGEKNKLVDELVSDLMKKGYTEEDAKTYAEVHTSSTNKVIDDRFNARMEDEVIDLVAEALDEGKLDKKAYDEHKAEVLTEFRGRLKVRTARGNYRILKSCYDDVIRRKADAMRVKSKEDEEAKRQTMIAEGQLPPGAKPEEAVKKEDEEARKAIMDAGKGSRNPTFF